MWLNSVKDFLSGNKKGADSKPPYFLAFRSSTIFITATVCIAVFTDILLYGIIVPVIPYALTDRVGVSEDSVQTWNAILLACYTIALFIASPLMGVYADHTASRRWPLLMGLLALAGSTLLLCLGQTIALLILGRILQGLSAAIVWSAGLALLVDTVGSDNIGESMGYSSIAMSLGLLVSPAIGGAVYAREGYYAVYYVAFASIALDVILRLVLVEKKVARQWIEDESHEPDRPAEPVPPNDPSAGQSTEEQSPSEKQVAQVAAINPEGANTTAVPPVASRRRSRFPRLRLIISRRILSANVAVIMQSAVMFMSDTVLPLFVKRTFNWSSTAAGLIFFCICIPGFISPVVGRMADRWGAKWPSLIGFVFLVPLLVCLRFVTQNTIGHKVLLGVLLSLMGVALTFASTPLMAETTYAIEAEKAKDPTIFGQNGVYGLGYGLFCLSFALGGSIGSLMAGYIVNGAGWATMTWSFAIWTAAGAVVVGLWLGEELAWRKKQVPASSNTAENGNAV